MSERRLAAIMFTDIVGYTALMGRDEDLAFETLRKNRKIHQKYIEKHHGSLIKEIGDGMLVSFHLASDAVRCAMEIQREAKGQQIPLKIGIHEGEMVFEGMDVLGDGVNVASRLQKYTEEGCISISGAVYKDVKNKADINAEFIEEKIFKNVDEPIKVYNVHDYKDLEVKDTISITTESKNSIAVLPFVNMSNDPEQEYFCDGISEEIINALTHVESLKVIARTSAFEFKNKNVDIRIIGQKLGVETLLEGSVRKAGNRLRITAQLINVSDGSHLWSERYDREMADIFEIQDEISLAIVQKLRIQLLEGERKQVLKSKTYNQEAYNYYLKGLYQWYKRTREGMAESMKYYQTAIDADPNYALAYTGLAGAYIAMADWGELLPKEALPKARDLLQRSFEIDDSLADTYALFGYLNLSEWNKDGAEQNIKKALEINPNLPLTHHIGGLAYAVIEDFDKALAYNRRARELDPFNLIFNFAYGIILYMSRKYELAINQFHNTLVIDETFMPAMLWSFYGYLKEGKNEEAIKEYQKILFLDPISSEYIPATEEIFKKDGIEGLLRWVINEGLIYYKRPHNHPFHKALCFALLDEIEKALDYLEETFKLGSLRIIFIKTESAFDKLNTNPRYQVILENVGLW